MAFGFWSSCLVIFWSSCLYWNNFFFYWTSCFIEQLFFCFIEQFLVISENSNLFFSNFLGWVGRCLLGPSPTPLYMHMCIWRGQIITSFGPNIDHLFFLLKQLFLFYWNSFFLFSGTSCLLKKFCFIYSFKNFLGWVGRCLLGPSPTPLYMHMCIWRGQIITSFGPNIDHLFFLLG